MKLRFWQRFVTQNCINWLDTFSMMKKFKKFQKSSQNFKVDEILKLQMCSIFIAFFSFYASYDIDLTCLGKPWIGNFFFKFHLFRIPFFGYDDLNMFVFSIWKKVDEKSETWFFIGIFQMKKGWWKEWNLIFHWHFPNEKRWMKRVKFDFSLFIGIFKMKKGGWKEWNLILSQENILYSELKLVQYKCIDQTSISLNPCFLSDLFPDNDDFIWRP